MSGAAGNRRHAGTGRGRDPRSAARLAAVQALYQLELNDGDPEGVILEFLDHRLEVGLASERLAAVDRALFADLVRGAVRRQREIDPMLRQALASGWQLERLESVSRAILRCGAYELLVRADIPARATINEYVELAHDFFAGDEPRFVNAVLDRIGQRLRGAELGGPGDGGRTEGR